MIEKWEKIKEELVYNGYRKISIWTFLQPNGKEVNLDIKIENDAVCVLAQTENKKFVMARQYRPAPNMIMNELPGGGSSDGDKSPEEGIKREFLEETGFTGDFKLIGSSYNDCYSTRKRHHFVATNCRKITEPKNDDTEFTEPVLLSLEELKKSIEKGEITDSETALRGLIYLKLL